MDNIWSIERLHKEPLLWLDVLEVENVGVVERSADWAVQRGGLPVLVIAANIV